MISSDHLGPGQAGNIRATVSTAGRTGRLEKYITIYSSDPATPALTLSLTLDVI